MQYLYWLDHLQPQDRPLVGEAAYALGVAAQMGHPVLPGVIVAAPLFMNFLESVDWVDPLFADFPHSPIHLDVGNPSQLQAIAQRIQDLIQSQAFPEPQQTDIFNATQSLPSSRLILRPSLGISPEYHIPARQPSHSIAPLFHTAQSLLDTLICEPDHPSQLMDTIRKLWSSFFRASHLFYWRRMAIPFHHLRLGIVISPVTSALASGVLHLNLPQTEVKAVWGMASGLINGDIQSDVYRYANHDSELKLTQTHIWTKRYVQILPEPTSGIAANHSRRALTPSSSGDGASAASPRSPFPSALLEAETHLLPLARAKQPVLEEPLLRHLMAQVQGLAQHLEYRDNDALQVEWTICPTWNSLVPSENSGTLDSSQALEDSAMSPPALTVDNAHEQRYTGWPVADSPLILMLGDKAPDLCSLVIDDPAYSIYLTEILMCGPEVGAEREDSAIAPGSDVASAVDIALDHERLRSMPVASSMASAEGGRFQERAVSAELDHANPDGDHLVGIGTSSGQVTAPLWVMTGTQPVTGTIPSDHILLTNSISPVWLNALRGAKGVISTQGGMTCHAAILARELGIPSVMGVANAMDRFATGDWIVLDGDRGTVTPLSPASLLDQAQAPQVTTDTDTDTVSSSQALDTADASHQALNPERSPLYSFQYQRPGGVGTATQLMLSLSQTQQIDTLAQQSVDGIGLIRAEIMLASLLHHQSLQSWLTPDHRSLLIQTIYHHIKQFAQAFAPRPIWYRTLDMRSHEWSRAQSTQGREINPLLGMHGTMSYQQAPGFFMAELEAIRQLQMEGVTNINLILPFVRTVEEFQFCHTIIEEMGLLSKELCEVWIMAEVPSILMLLPDYVQAGIKGIAIGSNDLTQLLLATDRTNPTMNQALKMTHPAVLRAIKLLITTARQEDIPCSLCGELASQHPEVIEELIRWGITTISVSPDAVTQTHQEILRAEKRLFLEWNRDRDGNCDRPFPAP